jgi:hypothetical protein
MNRLPNIEMKPVEELQAITEDLKIIDGDIENLNSDPFIRPLPIKPEQPKPVKRVASAKQKTHLANARKLAKEQKKKQKEEVITQIDEIDDIPEPVIIKPKIKEIQEQKTVIDPFEQFCENMDKFSNIQKRIIQKKKQEQEEAERKEAEQEAKYFKKFQNQQKEKEQPTVIEQETKQNEYGIYSNYF